MNGRDPGPLWRRIGAILARPTLTTAEKLLLVVLEWYTNEEGVAWPSVPTLGRRVSVTERTVYDLIARLEGLEILDVDHGGGRRRSNHYAVTLQPFQGFSDAPGGKTLQSTTETLKSAHENPEARSGYLSTYRSKDLSTSSTRATPAPASKENSPTGDAPAPPPDEPPPEPQAAAADGLVLVRADPERLAELRGAIGRLGAIKALRTPEEYDALWRERLAQAKAEEARRAG